MCVCVVHCFQRELVVTAQGCLTDRLQQATSRFVDATRPSLKRGEQDIRELLRHHVELLEGDGPIAVVSLAHDRFSLTADLHVSTNKKRVTGWYCA